MTAIFDGSVTEKIQRVVDFHLLVSDQMRELQELVATPTKMAKENIGNPNFPVVGYRAEMQRAYIYYREYVVKIKTMLDEMSSETLEETMRKNIAIFDNAKKKLINSLEIREELFK